jgi:hypothetical protein
VQKWLQQQSKAFIEYYRKEVDNKIIFPAIFVWLGILDPNYVLKKFEEKKEEAAIEEVDENDYVNIEVEIDKY